MRKGRSLRNFRRIRSMHDKKECTGPMIVGLIAPGLEEEDR